MSLIDLLRQGAADVPPSHVPTANELPGIVGALLAFVEHGEEAVVKALDNEQGPNAGWNDLFSPEQVDPAAPNPNAPAADSPHIPERSDPASPPVTATDDEQAESAQLADLQRRNAELQDQLAAAQGSAQRTTATVTPGDTPAPASPGTDTTPASSSPSSPTSTPSPLLPPTPPTPAPPADSSSSSSSVGGSSEVAP